MKLRLKKIKYIRRKKEVDETLKKYLKEHMRKGYIKKMEKVPKVLPLILVILKATKGE
jgi:hypothetical protein